ncbi:hypothetical protein JA33_152 [Dickeya phage vB_DsoM_JA33]|uniref:Uncharacterized protein n=2 Tax=Salmondvirus JA11 TaxID=2734141 RepID=A0A386K6R7_9CAUD|nr:hypothetical protein HOU32_gp152 [Dickeya phage vB_DsoM_JA11]AXG67526.1 hypothetical protein JA33_152 [Dickeya phage vB_DsoM_JA33]AYD79957.1 hypothetical protein JA11_152 [Dickeya phage vB_DsoM_JA11]
MSQNIRTSKVVVEIPPRLIKQIYDDTVKRVFSRTAEPATFEIEGIISIPNVLELRSVSYDVSDVFYHANSSFLGQSSGEATLTLEVVRLFPNL